ncbi:MAG: hypothetical protein FVQ81_01765 [Candidatus Glassbacteria bacterium]|nr:hypothetical protein [Candidatus Glassbacteria bacterium]
MGADFDKINVSGFRDKRDEGEFLLSVFPADAVIVWARDEQIWGPLLDNLAGICPDGRFTVEVAKQDGTYRTNFLPSVAVLPPPGREYFAGTTVGEQLAFYAAQAGRRDNTGHGEEIPFGLDFSRKLNHSVWELGEGERRCLLLASQSLAQPLCWILYSPLERMDGVRTRAVAEFISRQRNRGAIILAGTSSPAALLGCCNGLLALGDDEAEVAYYGKGAEAAEYLETLLNLPVGMLEASKAGRDKNE